MRALGFSLLAGSAFFAACTLITDVDREKIPEPPTPTFPQMDAGDAGEDVEDTPDASTVEPDAAPEAGPPPVDAGGDAGPDADAGDGG